MRKLFYRFVTLILVPCLIADPSFSAAFSDIQSSNGYFVRTHTSLNESFQQQAVVPTFYISSIRPAIRARIIRVFSPTAMTMVGTVSYIGETKSLRLGASALTVVTALITGAWTGGNIFGLISEHYIISTTIGLIALMAIVGWLDSLSPSSHWRDHVKKGPISYMSSIGRNGTESDRLKAAALAQDIFNALYKNGDGFSRSAALAVLDALLETVGHTGQFIGGGEEYDISGPDSPHNTAHTPEIYLKYPKSSDLQSFLNDIQDGRFKGMNELQILTKIGAAIPERFLPKYRGTNKIVDSTRWNWGPGFDEQENIRLRREGQQQFIESEVWT